jgi:hypothetical protein
MGIFSRKKNKTKSNEVKEDDGISNQAAAAGSAAAPIVSPPPPPPAPRGKRLVKRAITERLARQESYRQDKLDEDLSWTNTEAHGQQFVEHDLQATVVSRLARRPSGDTMQTQSSLPAYQPPIYSLFSAAPTDEIASRYINNEATYRISKLPSEIWRNIATYLNPVDAGTLALANRMFRLKLGSFHTHLSISSHKHQRIASMLESDQEYPAYLFCFVCTKYHVRKDPGREKLPTSNLIEVFNCPNATNMPPPRLRLTDKRVLPYSFVQLMMRHYLYGDSYGVSPESLTRRWTDSASGWTHAVRFAIVPYPWVDSSDALDLASGSETLAEKGIDLAEQKYHVLMRVHSSRFAPADLTESEQRLFLYSRNDYAPYFSCCAHWNGPLLPLAKCALSHVPPPAIPIHEQLAKGPKISLGKRNASQMAILCGNCRPLRRCSECPTEYLMSIKLVEDRRGSGAGVGLGGRVGVGQSTGKGFAHAMSITRWSDLGDASNPWMSQEWAAIVGKDGTGVGGRIEKDGSYTHGRGGQRPFGSTGSIGDRRQSAVGSSSVAAVVRIGSDDENERYDSFNNVGRLTLCSRFEMAIGNDVPGERCLPLNYDDQGEDVY